jgi:hypothetical protein
MLKIYSFLSALALVLWVATGAMTVGLALLYKTHKCVSDSAMANEGMDWFLLVKWVFTGAVVVVGLTAILLSTYWHRRCPKIALTRADSDPGSDTDSTLAHLGEPLSLN